MGPRRRRPRRRLSSALQQELGVVVAEEEVDLVPQQLVALRARHRRRPGRRPASRAMPTHSPISAQRGQLQVVAPLLTLAHDRALAPQLEVDLGQLEAVGRLRPAPRGGPRRRRWRPRPRGSRTTRSAPRPTRPRSWWSWAIPKRSASRITITVALGTSTPTSITVVATSTSRRAGPERGPSPRSFSAARHPAVQQPEPEPVELAGRRAARRSPRPSAPRASRSPRSAGTRRRPGARRDLGPHRAPTARTPPARLAGVAWTHVGLDRRATRRQLVEHRHVEVAVDGHRRRARNRRGRHHQHVGNRAAVALRPAARPAARRRTGAARRSRRRPASGTRPPPGSARGCRSRCRPRRTPGRPGCVRRSAAADPVGEQLDPERSFADQRASSVGHRRILEQLGHPEVMLLGQHLGRRHRARPGGRPRPRPAARRRPRPSCPSRRRPAAVGASGCSGRGRRRSRRSPAPGRR